ncbi:unnamed protein product [Clonostachys rosea]|uniref:Alpha-L-rhamnosidase n=1 Tax=Bionectria ochroleuca TaxID=29856 RepID=A0ABY6TY45_BIOOC|nr:unnamed protein product [Clonostachys rosea]
MLENRLQATYHIAPEQIGYLKPKSIQVTAGSADNVEALYTGTRDLQGPSNAVCTLTTVAAETPTTLLLDYGVVVSGVPVFFVRALNLTGGHKDMELQVTYSEVFAYIDRPDGDGPFPFTAGADTLRVNTYNVDRPGMIEHFQLQGGQRWQKIELLTPGTLEFTLVGFKPTTFNLEPRDMPGYFECSDAFLNKIWSTGARTTQINSAPARTNPVNWHVLPTGTYISSQRVSHYIWGGSWDDYAVQVEVNILDGGFALAIKSRAGFGPLFQFYLNDGRLKIDLLYGFYNQAQITLWQTPCDSWEQDITGIGLSSGWNQWEVTAYGTETYAVLLNGKELTTFDQDQGEKTDTNNQKQTIKPHEGSFGFGTGKDQTAIFRNTRAMSSNGSLLYSSSLRDPHVLSDFAVNTNQLPCMLDGAKRDRAVWLGDTIVPALALYYSTGIFDFVLGSMEAILQRQREDGSIPAYSLIGFPAIETSPEKEVNPPFELLAGSFTMYVVRLCHDYLLYTGNIKYMEAIYPKLQKLISLLTSKVDKRDLVSLNGLWAMDSDYYNKARSGSTTKNNAVYVIALNRIALIADALGDSSSAETYRLQASKTTAAVNSLLFNPDSGLYDASENDRNIVSEDANAFALLAGFPDTPNRQNGVLQRLHVLKSPGGYLSFDRESGYMKTPVVSPIMNGWHAEAALQAGGLDNFNDTIDIWNSCWGPMIDEKSPFYSGCHWEFSTPEGKPFMEHFCSMAHPFSSLPVYSLSVHALGLSPTKPGWTEFELRPHLGFLNKLDFVRGRVPIPHDQTIHASWSKKDDHSWVVSVQVPLGHQGRVIWPQENAPPKYNGFTEREGFRVGPGSYEITVTY